MTDKTDREALAAVLHNNFEAARGRQGVSSIALADAVIDAGWSRGSVRVQPTRDEIAETLATTNDDSWCFQRIRDWNALEQWERNAQPQEEPFSDYEERDWYLARADAILALFSSTPTVAQVQAEALREAAKEWDEVFLVGKWLLARADALDPKEEN